MASVLVTGATGFIGRALCCSLRGQGEHVVELSSSHGDIANPATLDQIAQVHHVFHLAGRMFVPDSWNNPIEFQKVNVLGTANILEFCRRHDARLTFVSSYLYGEPDKLPVSEACVLRPNNPYALSKHLAEQLCAFYAMHYGVSVTVIRPFNVFGYGQKPHFLIPQILKQVKEGLTIRVKDLAPRRDYIYVADLVASLVRTLGGLRGYHVFNIGSGMSISVSEAIAVIQSVAGTKLSVVSEEEVRINEINDVYADISKARALLGWLPNVTFRQGIERVIVEEANL